MTNNNQRTLKQEIAKIQYKAEHPTLSDQGRYETSQGAMKIINQLQEIVEMQQEALWFYAERKFIECVDGPVVYLNDSGQKAQETLEKSKQLLGE